jgi:hydroxyacylglutathione hydrolase
MMRITRIVNSYRSSNTFIVEIDEENVILVDVGGPGIAEILSWLSERRKNVHAVFLTHEHADHCLGVNELYRHGPFPLYCSRACSMNIRNSRQNFSFYSDEIPTFEITVPTTVIESNAAIQISSTVIKGIETPGHSPGSMCYLFNENCFFSGDTLLNNVKTPLTFPHSNKQHYAESLGRIEALLPLRAVIYPGHGDEFVYEDQKQISV